jgi:predicted transposase/invertase (TIGR01784 family)
MAVDTLASITQDEIEYERMSNLIKSQLDWNTDLFEAEQRGRDEGLREGLNKGLNQASLDIAQKMKIMGFSAEQIQAATGLSTETIIQL